MTIKTKSGGFFQSDIIIRTALIAAFKDIRLNPWLLDFCFSGLINDHLTRETYGEKQLIEAKQYFKNNDIPIVWVTQPDFSIPRIVIIPTGSNEAEATLGDIHYTPTELVSSESIVAKPSPTVGPFTPIAYNIVTGYITLPPELTTRLLFPGMRIVDTHNNKHYEIQEVVDDSIISIEPGTVANFTNCFTSPFSDLYMARLESIEHQKSFRIETYVSGNPVLSIYLNSILIFALNKYKQEYFEARGYERQTMTEGPVEFMQGQSDKEIIYMQSVNLSGYVRQYWPKSVRPLIQGLLLETVDGKPGINVDSNITSDGTVETLQGWGTKS